MRIASFPELKAALDELHLMGSQLLDRSSDLDFISTDPRRTSSLLYQRLWSNFSACRTLLSHGHPLEADIIIRSVVECTICIAANHNLKEDFYEYMIGDLKASIKIKLKDKQQDGDKKAERAFHKMLRGIAEVPSEKGALRIKELAEKGGYEPLYWFYKRFSDHSAHVSAFSLLRSSKKDDAAKDEDKYGDKEFQFNPMLLAETFKIGMDLHAQMIGADDIAEQTKAIDEILGVIPDKWDAGRSEAEGVLE